MTEGAIGKFAGMKQAPFPSYFPPMLASLAEKPFSSAGWIYEPKMDGMRCVAFVDGSKVKLLSRRGQNITSQYPALAAALPELCKCRMVLDGEIIALNEQARPSFQLLQKRMNLQKVADISRADARIPVHYFVFDLIHAGDYALAKCALADRKKILQENLQQSAQVVILNCFEEDGQIAYQACVENGFEGIVAKRRDSIYEPGRRSPYWVKVKAQKSSEFVIAGYSQGQGGRASTFGSLLLGYYDDEPKLVYAGSVGTGFDERLLAEMMRRMVPLKTNTCPFKVRPEDKKDATWLLPELVAEIKFMDFTEDKHLRNPVFLHLRPDIRAEDVHIIPALLPAEIQSPVDAGSGTGVAAAEQPGASRPSTAPEAEHAALISENTAAAPATSAAGSEPAAARSEPAASPEFNLEIQHWKSVAESVITQLKRQDRNMSLSVEQATISLTNLDKVLFPPTDRQPPVLKRDFLRIVAFLAPYILSHLRDRPLTMIRAPGGMKSRSFYQKHWNLDIPDFIEAVRTEFTDPERKDQLLCNNVASLIFLAQHNILEYHCWLSRVPAAAERLMETGLEAELPELDLPDYMAFDIDFHKENEKESDRLDVEAFKRAREAAQALQSVLQQLKLRPFLKTSGRNGLHIFIPIIAELRYEQVRTLAETIAKHMEANFPQLITKSAIQARKSGKVFLDYQANTRGKSLAAAYTPRLTPEATISTPIEWDELAEVLPSDFNQHTIRDRLQDKGDIWSGILLCREELSERFSTRPKT